MTETFAQQRERIIATSDVDAETFDLIASLGYQPESWDGMWKLVSDPIVFRGLGVIVLREVVYQEGTHNAVIVGTDADPRIATRLVIRRGPEHKGKLSVVLALTTAAVCFAYVAWAVITATAAW